MILIVSISLFNSLKLLKINVDWVRTSRIWQKLEFFELVLIDSKFCG